MIRLTLLSFASSGAAFLLELLLARKYGSSPVVDAFRAAHVGLVIGAQLIVTQLLPHVIIPYFQDLRGRLGDNSAWRAFGSLFWLITAGSVAAALAVAAGREQVGRWLAPGLEEEGRHAITALMPALAVTAALILVCGSLAAVLNIYDSFAAGVSTPLFLNIGWLAMVLRHDDVSNAAWALGTGAVAGGLAALAVHLWTAVRVARTHGIHRDAWRPAGSQRLELRRLAGGLLVPMAISLGALHLGSILIQRSLSLQGAGVVAVYMYAQRLTTIVHTPAAMYGTRLFPDLARAASEPARFLPSVAAAVRGTLAIGVPAAVAAWIAREPLVTLLFGRGTLSAEALTRIASLFGVVIVAAPLGAVMALLHKVYAARFQGWTLAAISSGCTLALTAMLAFITDSGEQPIAGAWVAWIALNTAVPAAILWWRRNPA